MSKGPQRVHKSDVRRAIEAIELAGKKVNRIEIAKDGKLILFPTDGEDPKSQESSPLDDWMADRANSA